MMIKNKIFCVMLCALYLSVDQKVLAMNQLDQADIQTCTAKKSVKELLQAWAEPVLQGCDPSLAPEPQLTLEQKEELCSKQQQALMRYEYVWNQYDFQASKLQEQIRVIPWLPYDEKLRGMMQAVAYHRKSAKFLMENHLCYAPYAYYDAAETLYELCNPLWLEPLEANAALMTLALQG
jgi:hypothetical protein